MAKLKNDAIAKDDLLEYLKGYSDFSFELSVLRMLRELGLKCEHGGYYEDPVTQKSREFDVRARSTIEPYRVRIAVECKNIRENFPVLISCIPRHAQESYHEIAMVGEPSSPYAPILHVPRAKRIQLSGGHSLYKQHDPVGKSTVQVGRTSDGSLLANDRELYERWGQCLSSADDLVHDAYWDGKDGTKVDFSAVFPFVVVPNDRLWTVSFDEKGNQLSDPEPSDRCSCFIDKVYEIGTPMALTSLRLSHLEIVTFDGMRSFVEEYLTTEEGMKKVFPLGGMVDALDGSSESD